LPPSLPLSCLSSTVPFCLCSTLFSGGMLLHRLLAVRRDWNIYCLYFLWQTGVGTRSCFLRWRAFSFCGRARKIKRLPTSTFVRGPVPLASACPRGICSPTTAASIKRAAVPCTGTVRAAWAAAQERCRHALAAGTRLRWHSVFSLCSMTGAFGRRHWKDSSARVSQATRLAVAVWRRGVGRAPVGMLMT
jgi:hypothetical protein